MENARSNRSSIIVLLLMAAVATTCAPGSARNSEDSLLRVGFGIGNSAKTSVRNLTDLLYAEALVARSWDGRQTPRLLTRWAWEDEGRTLRLELKEGVLLHDGSVLSSALVSTILQPVEGHRDLGFEHIQEVSAPDHRTVVIRLSKPDLFLLNGLADRRIVRPDSPEVGTGPFRLVARQPQVQAVRFEDYHGGVPPLSEVRIVTYETPRSAWAAFMRDEVDAVQEVNADSVEFMEDSTTVHTYPSLQPFQIAMVFNVAKPELSRVDVRRAIAEAVDRPAILERVMQGRGRVAEAPIWPNHWAYVPHPKRWQYAPESAKARLDRAGFAVREGNADRPAQRFTIRCMVYNEDPQYERIALMVQRQLFDVGIDFQIELVDLATIGERALAGDFDAYIMRSNVGRSMDFTYRFWRSDLPPTLAMQASGYSGADGALDRLRSSVSESDVKGAVAELAERFYEDVPAVFIAWLEVTRAVNTRFDVGGDSQDPLFSLWQWRPVGRSRP